MRNAALGAHNAALGVHNAALGVHNAALGVRNAALGVRNAALGVRNAALKARNAALGVRNTALGVRNAALGVRNAALRVRNSALGVRNAARGSPLFYATSVDLSCVDGRHVISRSIGTMTNINTQGAGGGGGELWEGGVMASAASTKHQTINLHFMQPILFRRLVMKCSANNLCNILRFVHYNIQPVVNGCQFYRKLN